MTTALSDSAKSSAGAAALSKAENKFIRLCEEFPDGLPDDVLQSRLESVPIEVRAKIINSLSGLGRLVLLQGANTILYKLISAEDAEKFTGLDHEGILIYRLVEQAGDRGVWIRELRVKSGLTQQVITKLIKMLMQKRLIKEIKSVQNNRKVYLKFDVEPSRDLIGGALSQGADLDAEFVKILRQACVKFIDKQSAASAEDISAFLVSSKISKIAFEGDDILQIINSLLYDGTIEKVPESSSGGAFSGKRKREETLYRIAKLPIEVDYYASTPCCVCVVADMCFDGSDISPTACEYYRAWLDF